MRNTTYRSGEGQRGETASCNCTNKLLHETPTGIVNEEKTDQTRSPYTFALAEASTSGRFAIKLFKNYNDRPHRRRLRS